MSANSPLGFVWEYLSISNNNSPSAELKSKKFISSREEIFIKILKSHSEIWRGLTENRSRIICCPLSNSLGIESIPIDYLLSHIIEEGNVPGEFNTLNNQIVYVSGNYLVCGDGFKETRKVKILNIRHLFPNNDSNVVYVINRPLIGGLLSPEDSDEVNKHMMNKYIATLRSFPELESHFRYLTDKVKALKINYMNLSKAMTKGYYELRILLIKDLKELWKQVTNKLLQTGDITNLLSVESSTQSDTNKLIAQIIENYIMNIINDFLYPFICREFELECKNISNVIIKMKYYNQSDIGIRPEFQTPLSDAIKELLNISKASNPVDKMIVFKMCVYYIRESVNSNINNKYPDSQVEFATDDLLLLIIWVIIQCHNYYQLIFIDVKYCLAYHFNSCTTSELGFNLCHFEVALNWFQQQCDNNNMDSLQYHTMRILEFLEYHERISFLTSENNGNRENEQIGSNNYDTNKNIFSTPNQKDKFCNSTRIVVVDTTSPSFLRSNNKQTIKSVDLKCKGFNLESETSTKVNTQSIYGNYGYYSAISGEGVVYTWGIPDSGRLGRGPTVEMNSYYNVEIPRPISRVGKDVIFKQVSGGRSHMIALTLTGEVYVWGDNRLGQLGLSFYKSSNNNNNNSLLQDGRNCLMNSSEVFSANELSTIKASGPVVLACLQRVKVVSIACGAHHSLCLEDSGVVYSWGKANNGRLGQFADKSNMSDNMICRPAVVKSKWMRRSVVSKADFSSKQFDVSMILEPSSMKENSMNNNDSQSFSYDDKSLVSSKICFIAAGFDYSIAVTTCGAVFTWGCGSHGSLGHGSHCDVYLPKQVFALNCEGVSIVSVSASHHTLFLTNSGLLFGCGLNNYNQIGSLSKNYSSKFNNYKCNDISILYPQPVLHLSSVKDILLQDSFNFSTFKKISCGDFQSAAITNSNELLVWGNYPILNSIITENDFENSKVKNEVLDSTVLDISIKTIRQLSNYKINLKNYICNEYSDIAVHDIVCMDQIIAILADI